ncbi:MAG: ABC transporter permease [Clostridiales Family XIII bacterium]|jgi:ribose/xylose/arabinose/galactoside ABC-type transport system permease subunit|nr:ABC transporter permease [Clostridiales Family XIII bacterium]
MLPEPETNAAYAKYQAMRRKDQVFELFYKYGLYIVLAALIIAFSQFNQNFVSQDNIMNILRQTASTGIAAAGLVFVMVTGGIDVSMGSIIYMTAVIAATLANSGMGLLGAFAVSLLSGAAVGAVNGIFIAKLKVAPLIVTLAMLYVIRGLSISVVGIKPIFFNNDVGAILTKTYLFGFLPVIVVVLIVVMAVSQLLLTKSVWGRQLFAIGNNRQAAEVLGIKVNRNVFFSYLVCGAFAGLSGLISGVQVGGIPPIFAQGTEFIIICAVVLGGVSLFGGRGSAFPGAFIGVVIIMVIENGLVMARANMYMYTVVRGIVIFAAVYLNSVQNKGELR